MPPELCFFCGCATNKYIFLGLKNEIIVLNGPKVLKKIVIPNFRINRGHFDEPKLKFMANINDGHLLVGD